MRRPLSLPLSGSLARPAARMMAATHGVRPLVQDAPTTCAALVTGPMEGGLIISGGTSVQRSRLFLPAVMALSPDQGIVVLHTRNHALSRALQDCFGYRWLAIGPEGATQGQYDPMNGLTPDVFTALLTQAFIDDERPIPDEALAVISGVCRFLTAMGQTPTLARLASCPFYHLPQMVSRAPLDEELKRIILQDLRVGERYYAQLTGLLRRCLSPSGLPPQRTEGHGESVLSVLRRNGMVMVDLGHGQDTPFLKLLLTQLRAAAEHGVAFTLAVDQEGQMPRSLARFMAAEGRRIPTLLATADLWSDLSAEQNAPAVLLDGAALTAVLHCGAAADRWSRHIGDYDHFYETTTTNETRGRSHKWYQVFGTFHNSTVRGTTLQMMRHPILTAPELIDLPPDTVVALKRGDPVAAHLVPVTNLIADTDPPDPNRRVPARTRLRGLLPRRNRRQQQD